MMMSEHEKLPVELANAGITNGEWGKWMEAYQRDVSPYESSCQFCTKDCWWLCCGTFCFWGPLYFLCCCPCVTRNDPLQVKMRAWFAIVNADLEPKGMYMKGQTKIGEGKHAGPDTFGLVFALTADEVEKLKQEPVISVHGRTEDATTSCFHAQDRGRVI